MKYRQSRSPIPFALFRKVDDFGIPALDLIRAPSRFWSDGESAPEMFLPSVDEQRLHEIPSPLELLRSVPDGDSVQGQGRRSIALLSSWFLACEDSQRRLEARTIATLAHQASLVQYILETPRLRRVLIADEVGLGKTIEAALILQGLLQENPGLRILFLAPARLVRNVRREFDRLDLSFRIWASGTESDARLRDNRIVASIHRAVHPAHVESFVNGPDWDVIVVDECHHLSDWGDGGGKPTRRYQLVNNLLGKLRHNGRLILLSGTPHQGSRVRFENLLRLLLEAGQNEEELSGQVIFRTKDDIFDWEGKPLFPRRDVREPVMLDLQPNVRAWIEGIYQLFSMTVTDSSEPRRRAAGWRVYQALQWATSSIQAGLGYLVRQAVRAEWDLTNGNLRTALAALRPYRNGDVDEDLPLLYQRLVREIRRQSENRDLEDIEEFGFGTITEDLPWRPDPDLLEALLAQGVELLETSADSKWDLIWEQILEPAGSEKVVLFAQPIETVTALARYLENRCGQRPAMIIGNQDEEVREREITNFWADDGPRFLISSKAGGEGINLQVARRLVHVDVPWNPMEMEQRVGRVHRFMSRRTILVDTVVVSQSREVDMYRIARDKLHEITRTLVAPERFEELFSRVMALVPPEQIQEVLAEGALGPLSNNEAGRLSQLVTAGFENWQAFHTEYGQQSNEIQQLDPGQAGWADFRYFLENFAGATPRTGFSALAFELDDSGEVLEASQAATVLEHDGQVYACGDYGGMPITAGTQRADVIGLNTPFVADELRRRAFPQIPTGAAHLRLPASSQESLGIGSSDFGVSIFARLSLSMSNRQRETSSCLVVYIFEADGKRIRVADACKGDLIRALLQASVRREPSHSEELLREMDNSVDAIRTDLMKPSEEDRAKNRRHVIFPIFSALVTTKQ